jgi:hypothetical protein
LKAIQRLSTTTIRISPKDADFVGKLWEILAIRFVVTMILIVEEIVSRLLLSLVIAHVKEDKKKYE